MPINRKLDYIREISQMVRKESFSFDPQDRVQLKTVSFSKNREQSSYFLGDIYHDFDLGKLCFRIYNEDGKLIVPNDGPRILEDVLTPKELFAVAQQVNRYFQNSLSRAKNLSLINDLLEGLPDHIFRFTNSNAPVLSLDRNLDGRYVDVNLLSVFKDPLLSSNIWAEAFLPRKGETFNYDFAQLSDHSVSSVLRGLELQIGPLVKNEEKSVSSSKSVKQISF